MLILLCNNCKGSGFVYDALGTRFFCPKCQYTIRGKDIVGENLK